MRRDAGTREEGIECIFLELTTIVTLKFSNLSIKIILNKSTKRDNGVRGIKFVLRGLVQVKCVKSSSKTK